MHLFLRGFRALLLSSVLILPVTLVTAQAQIDPANVTIIRDTLGVPHIYAPTDAEAAYGLAYAYAEDNFHDIQEALLAGKGMLGSVKGKDGVLFDFALQFLKIDSLVDADYETALSEDYRKVVEGYVQGINAYAAAHPKERLLKKAFPITPQDVVKGYTLSLTLMAGLGMALKAVNENRIDEFFASNEYFGTGSNAMAVAPERMEDGKGYLLVNSHQPIEGRFAWYEAHINSEEGWNMVGGTFAGGITVFVGSNTRLGWGHTFNYHQFGDIYKLEINPENKDQYRFNGKWLNFRKEKVKLKVKVIGLRIPVRKKVKYSTYGPVWETKHGSYAFRFPGYMDIRAGEQWYRMNKANNFNEFLEATKMQAVPLFNIVYGDADGNIMMHSGGAIPKRDSRLNWKPPVTSDDPAYKWTELLDFSDLPNVTNPDCGYVYNANNTPLHCTGDSCEWYDRFPGLQTFMYNRGERFGHLLEELGDEKFTEADLDRIKFDASYHPDGMYASHFKAMYELDETKYPDIADAIRSLKAWDRSGDDITDVHAGLAMVVHDNLRLELDAPFALLMIRNQPVPEDMAVRAIRKAKKFLLKTHGTIDVPLGDLQRLIRGDKSLPADGLREVPRATDTKLHDKKKGIYKVTGGDGYIQVVRYDEDGADIRSINAYGASSRPESPHYNDQMEMFIDHEYRHLPMTREGVMKISERVYHPGE